MKSLSRGAWIGLAAVVAVPATVAIAKTVEQTGWMKQSPETRARLEEGRLAMAKAALKLTPEQEKLWSPIEAQARDAFKAREAKRDEWKKTREERQKERAEGKRPDLAERFEKMSANASDRATRLKAFSDAFKPFYASLSDEQKDVVRPLLRGIAPGMEGRGHHGPRWAFNGWGPHGWGGKHDRHGEMGDGPGKGGPAGDDASPDKAPDAK